MPFPYVTTEEFREDFEPDHDALGFPDDDAYEAYLDRKLKTASETIEGDRWTGSRWREAAEDAVPRPVKEAVIRLARLRIDQRLSDALSSEQSPSGRQESYRDPAEVEASIRESLHDAGYGSQFWSRSL